MFASPLRESDRSSALGSTDFRGVTERVVTSERHGWCGVGFAMKVRALLVQPFIWPQITDFSQRKSDRSSYEMDELPVTEQELQKLKNPDTEQELEVSFKYCKFISSS